MNVQLHFLNSLNLLYRRNLARTAGLTSLYCISNDEELHAVKSQSVTHLVKSSSQEAQGTPQNGTDGSNGCCGDQGASSMRGEHPVVQHV